MGSWNFRPIPSLPCSNRAKNMNAPTIAIIGGGFTGAAVALHLAEHFGHGRVRLVVVEPRQNLGTGLAYDTTEPVNRINVPAARMSLYPDEPGHFSTWLAHNHALADDPDAFTIDGAPYPRRELFGQYVTSTLAPHLTSGQIEHWRTRAIAATKSDGRWTIRCEDGSRFEAHILVLAVSHPAPTLPASLANIANHPALVADATSPFALDHIARDARVLVVGNGLTAADVIAALKRRQHRGKILAISRRGLRSRSHLAVEETFAVDLLSSPSLRASDLLRRVRQAVRTANAEGLSWHPVLDAVRAQGQEIWRALPVSERRRIARHVRPFWDVHRFRIAPQVAEVVERAIADGSLTIAAARLHEARENGKRIRVTYSTGRRRERTSGDFDAIVITTGPAHGGILLSQPLLTGLAAQGRLALCPTGLGLHCDMQSRALGDTDAGDDTLLIAGPLARGTFGELMGLPQVSEHAAFIARNIASLVETKHSAR